jgi:hypothetical protein
MKTIKKNLKAKIKIKIKNFFLFLFFKKILRLTG